MLVSEIFYSVQGEGQLTGVPSVFIRSSGCNLRCRWCDTKYASWDPGGDPMTTREVVEEVNKYPARHVVVTGGEPMVARDIRDLLRALHAEGKHITIETAGTIMPDGVPCDLASISPKLSNSTPREGEIENRWIAKHDAMRLSPEVLQAWIDGGYDYQFKFVVSTVSDLGEIRSLLTSIGREIPPHLVLLMPEGTDVATLQSRNEMLLDLCKHYGYRFCTRLHIGLFGNTPGT